MAGVVVRTWRTIKAATWVYVLGFAIALVTGHGTVYVGYTLVAAVVLVILLVFLGSLALLGIEIKFMRGILHWGTRR